MRHGFIRVGAATTNVEVANVAYNKEQICKKIDEAVEQKIRVLGFPELCVTSYTCSDLFWQEALISASHKEVLEIKKHTKGKDIFVVISFPYSYQGNLYNCAAALFDGEILGIVPKKFLPNYSEFYEARHFAAGIHEVVNVPFGDREVPFGMNQLFVCENMPELVIAIEICEDMWVPDPPSIQHALAGATVIVNPSASDETIGKDSFRRNLISSHSSRLVCAYIYSSAGEGESTTDLVFSAHNIIAETGSILRESKLFENQMISCEVDLKKIVADRRRTTTFHGNIRTDYVRTYFRFSDEVHEEETELNRIFPKMPFVPERQEDRDSRCEKIIKLQANGLKKRILHTGVKNVVLGISGGLDSTLALLVSVEAFKMLNYDLKGIIAVTMPCFGTTDRTYQNACELTKCLGVTLVEISIKEAVMRHFTDLGHDPQVHDLTYENAQARERTQVLMNLASKYGGFVVGTGDMSELALGWATYNADHMSMYGVNGSIPKTLVTYLIEYYAQHNEYEPIREILRDILNTPVSPELLPPDDGEITQKTEDLVGPYELHDFFLFYVLKHGFEPSKIYRIACHTFKEKYEEELIYHWLITFYKRFFSQQFKRSCLPDGPKVGTVSLSPRGDLRMPSDACVALWIQDLETIKR